MTLRNNVNNPSPNVGGWGEREIGTNLLLILLNHDTYILDYQNCHFPVETTYMARARFVTA